MKMTIRFSAIAVLSLLLACGDSDDPAANNGNNGNNGSSNNGNNGSNNNGTNGNNGTSNNVNNGGNCSANAPTIVVEEAYEDDEGLYYFGASTEGFPYDAITLEWYQADVGPGTYMLGGNYEDCTFCSLGLKNCDEEDICETEFFATSGTFELSEYTPEGGKLVGVLKEATYVEVTIDSETFRSTPVANGETFCVTSNAVDAEVFADALPPVTCDPQQTDPVLTEQSVLLTGDAGDQAVLYLGKTSANDPFDALRVELVENRGASLGVGSHELEYFDYADCAYCVVADTGCTADSCTTTFLAVSGTLNVSASGALGETFSATLTGVEMAEHTIDENGDSELVAEGAGYCLTDLSITATLEAP